MSITPNSIETLKEARQFTETPVETELLLVRKHRDRPTIGKLTISRQVQQEITKLVSDVLTKYIDALREGTARARPLDVANTVSEETVIQCVRVDDLPDAELFSVLNSRDTHGTTTYDEEPEPELQLIRMSEPNGKLLIGVQNYSTNLVVDTTRELALWYRNKEYDRFASDLLKIPTKLNAVYYDGWVFVISPKSFERMFDMRSEYEQRAQDVLERFGEAGITFTDTGTIREWLLSHIHMLRGLYEIHENEIPEVATPDKIETIIKKYNLDSETTLEYTRRNGKIELDINDYQDSWKLLKLLGGKFAEDDIMETQWEIESGRRL